MNSDHLAVRINVDHITGINNLYLYARQGVGNTVKVLHDTDMTTMGNLGFTVILQLKVLLRQW